MKINLINLPSEETSILPPLDLAYIGALLKGHELKLVDFNFDEEVEDADLNIVGTTSVDYYNNPPLNLDHIFSYLDKIDGKKIIFGPHVTSTPKIFQKYGLLVIGEPEITIKESIDRIEKNENLYTVKGLYGNEKRGLIKDLDKLPFPNRSLINNKNYYNPLAKKKPYTMLISSRGCPFKCIYCYNEVFGHMWRARSAKNVIEEFREIKEKYKIPEVWIRDDLFSMDKERAIEICDGIKNIEISWSCQFRVDTSDRELLEKMYESGCHMVSLGIESGNREILRNLKKGITIEKVKEVVKDCKDIGIITRGYFIIGSPGETEETIKESFEVAKSLDLDYFLVSIMTPYVGTELYELGKKQGLIESDSWEESLKNAGKIETDFTWKELVDIKRELYKKYYLRGDYLGKRLFKFKILKNGFYPFLRQMKRKDFRGVKK